MSKKKEKVSYLNQYIKYNSLAKHFHKNIIYIAINIDENKSNCFVKLFLYRSIYISRCIKYLIYR